MSTQQSFLFHGSPTAGIKVLEPRRESRPTIMPDAPPAVYAGDDPAYCIGHGYHGSDLKRTEGGYWYKTFEDAEPVWGPFTLKVPRDLAWELEVPVSLYKVRSEGFVHLPEVMPTPHNYWSLSPVEVLEEIRYPSIREALEATGGELIVID